MTQQITIAGSNLFRIAAERLGDARQWWRIAQINNISDPMLSGVLTISIPMQNHSLIDGLPSP